MGEQTEEHDHHTQAGPLELRLRPIWTQVGSQATQAHWVGDLFVRNEQLDQSPVTVAVAIDRCQEFEEDLERTKRAVLRFVGGLRDCDRVGLVSYGMMRSELLISIKQLTPAHRADLEVELKCIARSTGSGNANHAVEGCVNVLPFERQNQTHALILAGKNRGFRAVDDNTMRDLLEAKARVAVVGCGENWRPSEAAWLVGDRGERLTDADESALVFARALGLPLLVAVRDLRLLVKPCEGTELFCNRANGVRQNMLGEYTMHLRGMLAGEHVPFALQAAWNRGAKPTRVADVEVDFVDCMGRKRRSLSLPITVAHGHTDRLAPNALQTYEKWAVHHDYPAVGTDCLIERDVRPPGEYLAALMARPAVDAMLSEARVRDERGEATITGQSSWRWALRRLPLGSTRLIHPKSQILIGRSGKCEIWVDDRRASRSHAVLETELGRLYLRDLETPHGTRVNGEPIREQELFEGDIVSIGGDSAEFEVERSLLEFRRRSLEPL